MSQLQKPEKNEKAGLNWFTFVLMLLKFEAYFFLHVYNSSISGTLSAVFYPSKCPRYMMDRQTTFRVICISFMGLMPIFDMKGLKVPDLDQRIAQVKQQTQQENVQPKHPLAEAPSMSILARLCPSHDLAFLVGKKKENQ